MNSLEDMRIYENYAEEKVLQDCYIAVRVDGRTFHTEVKRMKLKRPFDKSLRKAIEKAAKEVMKDFGAVFAYTESDEVTFLFPKKYESYDRRAEKLASL